MTIPGATHAAHMIYLWAEVLLQQTDAPKVVAVYCSFTERFATAETLAQATLAEGVGALIPAWVDIALKGLSPLHNASFATTAVSYPIPKTCCFCCRGSRAVCRPLRMRCSVRATKRGTRHQYYPSNGALLWDPVITPPPAEDAALWTFWRIRLLPPRTLAEPAE